MKLNTLVIGVFLSGLLIAGYAGAEDKAESTSPKQVEKTAVEIKNTPKVDEVDKKHDEEREKKKQQVLEKIERQKIERQERRGVSRQQQLKDMLEELKKSGQLDH